MANRNICFSSAAQIDILGILGKSSQQRDIHNLAIIICASVIISQWKGSLGFKLQRKVSLSTCLVSRILLVAIAADASELELFAMWWIQREVPTSRHRIKKNFISKSRPSSSGRWPIFPVMAPPLLFDGRCVSNTIWLDIGTLPHFSELRISKSIICHHNRRPTSASRAVCVRRDCSWCNPASWAALISFDIRVISSPAFPEFSRQTPKSTAAWNATLLHIIWRLKPGNTPFQAMLYLSRSSPRDLPRFSIHWLLLRLVTAE